jgi:protein-L-isoaspartate O-methyltransferase
MSSHLDRIRAMRDTLSNGGAVAIAAPQLFPTPDHIARRMVELAEIGPEHRVLEPSAGTGALLRALPPCGSVVCVELDFHLAAGLARDWPEVYQADFLDQSPSAFLGRFDRVVMNPPFGKAADIRHILHALDFLTPHGRLVAICAGGPRQATRLRPLASHWEPLPPNTFAGTGVSSALLAIDGGM